MKKCHSSAPGPFGGHNWHPMAFSPKTGFAYIPTIHMIYPYHPDPDFKYNPSTWNTGEDWDALGASTNGVQLNFCSPTRLTAWHPIEQKQMWQIPFDSMVNAGVARHRRRPNISRYQRRSIGGLCRRQRRASLVTKCGRRHYGTADHLCC